MDILPKGGNNWTWPKYVILISTTSMALSPTIWGTISILQTETFHSSATMPEASLCPLTTEFRIDWKTVEYPTLTECPRLVRITPRDMAVRWHPCKWCDASGIVALLWKFSTVHTQPSLIWELQRRLKWKRQIQVENYWFARYCAPPLSGQAKHNYRQTEQPKRHNTRGHTKQSGQEGSHWRNSLYFYDFMILWRKIIRIVKRNCNSLAVCALHIRHTNYLHLWRFRLVQCYYFGLDQVT